jgi:hypothetical protein
MVKISVIDIFKFVVVSGAIKNWNLAKPKPIFETR